LRIRKTTPPAAAPIGFQDILSGLRGCLERGVVERREEEIRDYFGTKHIFFLSSGKAALVLILKGLLSLRAREKVLIPAYTCYSVPSAIVKSGLEIVLCDVDPETLDFDYLQLERLADDKTLCIVSTHLFGIPSDVDRTRRICEEKGIFLVEDAAQAMGVEHVGRKLGTLGDVGLFSMGRGKNITCGSGGIILTSSREIAESIRKIHRELKREPALECVKSVAEALFMKIFLNPYLYWVPCGLPFLGIGETKFDPDFPVYRLSNFKAGMLGSWREKMEQYNRCRILNGRHYKDAFALRKDWKIYSRELPYLRFPIYANNPDGKARACRRFGDLGVSPMYPDSVNRIEKLREYFGLFHFPGAERIAGTLMTLPTHILLADDDRGRICNSLLSEYSKSIHSSPAG
jgi:dTDP-4-amino-4,6-dideoxygalactose transaminase